MLLPILIHASPILIHASPILMHALTYLKSLTRLSALGSISYYIEPTRLVSAAKSTREPSALGSQSDSTITSPELSGNQNRARKKPINFVSESESCNTSPQSSANQNRALHRTLGAWKIVLGSRLESARYSLS